MRSQSRPRARRVSVAAEEPLIGADPYDYADAFEIQVAEPDSRSAEEFARASLEGAPRPMRWVIWIVHKYLLRLRLGPRSSPDHVLGWTVVSPDPDVAVLSADSPLVRGVIVGRKLEPSRVVVTTYVFFQRPVPARILWAFTAPLHRKVARYLLERTASRARAMNTVNG